MSLEEIRKTIDLEAKLESDKIKFEASTEAEAVLSAAKVQALEILKAAKAEASKEAERVRKELLSGAEIETNSVLLAARESVLEHAIGPVKRKAVKELSGKRAEKLIESAVKSFGKLAPKAEIIVKTSKKNIQTVRRLGFIAIQGEEDELTLATKDGRLALDASAKTLVEQYEKEARSLLAAKLFANKQ